MQITSLRFLKFIHKRHTPSKNQVLSEERARAVANYLSSKGVAAERITSIGYGDTRPLIREPDGTPNPKNRRVAFLIQE